MPDAPNAAYIQQLNAIVYNPEMMLETTLGHEWYHAATNLMMDQARRLEVNNSVWAEYQKEIESSAVKNGYTVERYAETFPGKAYTEEDFRHWITEEWLAERFGEYVNNKVKFTGKLKQFFEDLWEYIRMYFGNREALSLFDDIYNNRVAYRSVQDPALKDPLNIFAQSNVAKQAPKIIAKDGKYLMSRSTTEQWLDMVIKNKGTYPFGSSGISTNAGPSIYGDIIITTRKKIQDFDDITIANGNMFSPNNKLLAARLAYEEQKKMLSYIPGLYNKTFADFFAEWTLLSDAEKAPFITRLEDPEVARALAEDIYGRQIFNTNPGQENPFIYQVDEINLDQIGDQSVYQDALLDFLTKKNKIIQEF